LPYEEALQAGRIGLWQAIRRFDPHKGYQFSTYAYGAIVHQVWKAVKAHCVAEQRAHALIWLRYPAHSQELRSLLQRHSLQDYAWPEDTRIQQATFVNNCRISALQDRLPLRWGPGAHTPPSPKKSYRTHYQDPGWEGLQDPAAWKEHDNFELLLRLMDFSDLRDQLAIHSGWTLAKGKVPFV